MSSRFRTTQPVQLLLLLLVLTTSRQEATGKNRTQFTVQFPRVFNINIIMQRNLKSYGHQCTFWHFSILALNEIQWPESLPGSLAQVFIS
jgi:hypothetical protein